MKIDRTKVKLTGKSIFNISSSSLERIVHDWFVLLVYECGGGSSPINDVKKKRKCASERERERRKKKKRKTR